MTNVFLTLALVVGSIAPNLLLVSPQMVKCPTLPSARTVLTVSIPADDDYRFWLRQITPNDSQNNLYVQVDDTCAVAIGKNVARDTFGWVSATDTGKSLTWALSEGDHTVMIAGTQTSSAIDSGFFTKNLTCEPNDKGDCFVAAQLERSPAQIQGIDNRLILLLLSIWSMLFVGTVAFVVWKYHLFLRPKLKKKPHLPWHKHALLPSTLSEFVRHHQLFVGICGGILVALAVMIAVGVSALAAEDQRFEAESGVLSGGAKIVENAVASGGAYVAFDIVPPQVIDPITQTTSPSQIVKTTPAPSNNGGGGGSGNNGGGGSGGGGGGGPDPTPPGECPAYPAFPDEDCTGWRHTGVTLENCDHLIDNGYIWEDNPITVFDKCYFSGDLTIQAPGITITRSQVHGSISYHWSQNYSLRGLNLIDVEIEQEGVAEPRGAIGGNDWSCTRCNAHHGVTGMHFGDNTHIRDSYVHDMQWLDGSHGSGIATGQDHGSNSTIIHNNIQCNRVNGPPICSSALSIYPEDDNGDGITVHNVQVEKNLFNATGAYCVYAVSIPGSNINFIGNHFGKKFYPGCAGYGPVTGYGPDGGQWIDNKWADGSGPVDPS